MTHSDDIDETLRTLLGAETVAVIGCSTTPGKPAHDVPAYLARHGYEIRPVNPYAETVLGEPAADAVGEVDDEIDLVNVFRPSTEVAGIVDEVLDRVERVGDVWGLWLQLGITDDEALARASDAGLTTVQDRCMKVEHGRL